MRRYIGIMTGNSMDAIDIVYAQTDAETTLRQIYFSSYPFSQQMREDAAMLREQMKTCRTRNDIENLSLFPAVHQAYIDAVTESAVDFILSRRISLKTLAAVCFHGKTLDHAPPSRRINTMKRKTPYTVQMGSGQMLADQIARRLNEKTQKKTTIRVIYDFRSDDVFNGGEGAPLVPVLNAFTARQAGIRDRIDINAGNTSNLCIIQNAEVAGGYDLGPCNEYADFLIRRFTSLPFDENGCYARQGQLDLDLLQTLFNQGRVFYEKEPPKSGDPAIYNTLNIDAFKNSDDLFNKLHTAVYFAAYLMVYGLRFIKGSVPNRFLLFGGGWKNPVLKQSFQNLLTGKGFVLKEHKSVFQYIQSHLKHPEIEISRQHQSVESLLMVLMGAFFDAKKTWTSPVLTGCRYPTVCGIETVSNLSRTVYADRLCRACY